jgi:hypothetical protein
LAARLSFGLETFAAANIGISWSTSIEVAIEEVVQDTAEE